MRAILRRVSVFAVVIACVVASCSDSTGPDGPLRLLSVPEGDTVGAALAEPFAVSVPGARGTMVVFRANVVAAERNGFTNHYATTYFMKGPLDLQFITAADTAYTNDRGEARTFLRLGIIATEGRVTAFVPSSGDSVQADVIIRHGNATRLAVTPADTILYVGRQYELSAEFQDRWGNPFPAPGASITTTSSAIAVSGLSI